MRPLYETDADRVAQADVLSRLSVAWGVVAEPTEAGWRLPYDAWLHRGGTAVVGVVEVKRRNCSRLAHSTYMISERKIGDIRALGVPAWLVVEWTDGIGWLDLRGAPTGRGTGGRTDRGDPADVEPVLLYDIRRFHRLEFVPEDVSRGDHDAPRQWEMAL